MAPNAIVAIAKACKKYIGQKYGRLTIDEYIPGQFSPRIRARAICHCDCVTQNFSVQIYYLISKQTKSCGCWHDEAARINSTTHDMSGSPECRAWYSMRERCLSPFSASWFRYGGAGITIHERWMKFENFYEDLGPKPSPIHSLDRYPNPFGNYEPGNARWATPKEQARNRRNSFLLTLGDKTQCAAAWEDELGIKASILYKRKKRGWSDERALTTPVRIQ